jgi:hypothetical protein
MKRALVLTIAMLTFLSAQAVARAQWGWPPPGYNPATGVRCCDGSQYRGLRTLWRQHRQARRCCNPNLAETNDCSPTGPTNHVDAPVALPERSGR